MEEEQIKCLQCGGPVTPDDEKCPYCGYYNGHYYRRDKKPKPVEPTEEEEASAPSYYSSSRSSNGGEYLRSVVFFGVVLMVVTIIGTIFTNGTIQADFTAGAVLSASLLGILLFLGAVRLISL